MLECEHLIGSLVQLYQNICLRKKCQMKTKIPLRVSGCVWVEHVNPANLSKWNELCVAWISIAFGWWNKNNINQSVAITWYHTVRTNVILSLITLINLCASKRLPLSGSNRREGVKWKRIVVCKQKTTFSLSIWLNNNWIDICVCLCWSCDNNTNIVIQTNFGHELASFYKNVFFLIKSVE